MSDPSNTDSELDQYGVWVKKEVQSEKSAALPAADGAVPSGDAAVQESSDDSEAPDGAEGAAEPEAADSGGDEIEALDDFFADDDAEEQGSAAESDDAEKDFTPSDIATVGSEDAGLTSADSEMPSVDGEAVPPEADTAAGDAAGDDITAGEEELSPDSFDAVTAEDGEISLDEFDMGGDSGEKEVFLSDFDAAGAEDGEISLDSFFGDGDESAAVSEVHTEETEIADEEPLDIDLEFEDTADVPMEEDSAGEVDFDLDAVTDEGSGSSIVSDDGSESVDFSDFFSDADDASNADIPEKINDGNGMDDETERSFDGIFSGMDDAEKQEPAGSSDAGNAAAATEDVDLDAFDSPASGSEDVDLSDFGVDGSDDSMGGVKNEAGSEEDEDIKTNFDISVSSDDDIGDGSEESNASDATEEEVSIVQDKREPVHTEERQAPLSGASPDDDFDVDSLLDSIEDESGTPASTEDGSAAGTATAEEVNELPPLDDFETPAAGGTAGEEADIPVDPPEGFAEEAPEPEAAERTLPGEAAAEETAAFIPVPVSVSEETEADAEESLARNEEIDYSYKENAADAISDGEAEGDEEDMDGMNEILKQIAAEVSTLKQEIQGLKEEFDVIKKHAAFTSGEAERASDETVSDTAPADETLEEDDLIPVPSSENAESNFFSKDDDMDDVALDGSELNNILGTAELTEESVEPVQAEDVEAPAETAEDSSPSEEMDRALSEPLPPPEDNTNDDLMNDDVALSPDELGGIFNTADVTEEGSAAGEAPAEELHEENVEESLKESAGVVEESAETEVEAGAEDAAGGEADIIEESDAGIETGDDADASEVEELSIPIVDEEESADDFTAENLDEPVEAAEETLEEVPDAAADEVAEESLEPLSESLESDAAENAVEAADVEATDLEPVEEAEETAAEEPVDLFEESGAADEASGEEETVIPVEDAASESEEDMSRSVPDTIVEEEQPLTEENISYLESEEAPVVDEAAEVLEEAEESEEGEINEEPVEEVFNDWGGDAAGSSESEPEAGDTAAQDGDTLEEAEGEAVEAVAAAGEAAAFDEAEAAGEAETEAGAEAGDTGAVTSSADAVNIPENMKDEIKSVLSYMDQLLESLPEDKISQFAKSEEFNTYKKLFKELGLA